MSTNVLRGPVGVPRLRPKNQLTIPDQAVAAVGAKVGDRFVVTVEEGAIRLQPVLQSFAGALAGLYGDDWADELRRDRDTWPR